VVQTSACSRLREGWERQRPGAEADVQQARHGDRRKPVAGRDGTRLAARGLKRTARCRLEGRPPKKEKIFFKKIRKLCLNFVILPTKILKAVYNG